MSRPVGHITDLMRQIEKWSKNRQKLSLESDVLDMAYSYLSEYRELLGMGAIPPPPPPPQVCPHCQEPYPSEAWSFWFRPGIGTMYNLIAAVTYKGGNYIARCPELARTYNKYDIVETGTTPEIAVRRLREALNSIAGNPEQMGLDLTAVEKRSLT